MRGQVKIHQKKLAARRRRRAWLLSLYSVAAAGLLLSALSYITGLDSLSIQRVTVEGADRLATSTVDAVVKTDIAGTYGYFFSRANFLLYPKNQIQTDVMAIPLVKSADVSRKGLKEIHLSITERAEAARWCSGGFGDTSRCYSLDDAGFAFAPALPVASTSAGLIYRGALTMAASSSDPIGGQFLSPSDFKKIRFFMSELSGLSVEPREALLSGTTTAFYMTIALAGGGKLTVNVSDNLSTVLANIAAVISDRSIAPDLPKFLSKLDYMKLDIGNKVVYRLKK